SASGVSSRISGRTSARDARRNAGSAEQRSPAGRDGRSASRPLGPAVRLTTRFLLSATSQAHFPAAAAPEFCFLGRSNVGKSSLINALLGEKAAKISSTPGRTRSINFFALMDSPSAQQPRMLFADLPG